MTRVVGVGMLDFDVAEAGAGVPAAFRFAEAEADVRDEAEPMEAGVLVPWTCVPF